MTIGALILVVIIIVVLFWANNTYIPAPFKTIINVLLILLLLLITLQLLGWIPAFVNTRVN